MKELENLGTVTIKYEGAKATYVFYLSEYNNKVYFSDNNTYPIPTDIQLNQEVESFNDEAIII